MSFSRRRLLALALLPACNPSRPHEGFLGLMERFNAQVQAGMFRRSKLAPEEPREALTDPEHFPSYKVAEDYPEAPQGWTVSVKGLVAKPLVLSLAELRKLPRTDFRVRHHCVEGWSAVASWNGVRLSDLGRLCGADPRAGFVEFRSFEQGQPEEGGPLVRYSSSWDRESVDHPQTIVAYGKNGSPLTREEGAPLRLYSAVKLGYKMVKWVDEVVYQPMPNGGYWEDQGYEWFAGV